MKTKKFLMLTLAVAAMLSLASCNAAVRKIVDAAMDEVMNYDYEDSQEWGPVVTRDLNLGDFTKLNSHGSVRFEVTQDTACRLQVYGNEKRIEAYDIKVEDGVLTAEHRGGKDKIDRNTPRITLLVSVPMLEYIRVHGAGNVDMKGQMRQDGPLEIVVHGAGDIDIDDLVAESLKVAVSGAGDLDIDRVKCEGNVSLGVSGAGDMEASVECQELEATVSGAGDMDLNVLCDVVRVSVSGAGDIGLKGQTRKLYKSAGRASTVDTDELKVTEP
ncbi:MAG: DUF2807 domain-containing protein [Bacteroidaceae bacterium]|nr:DUF2807 domain-containing protein [Bacteroidaceae bacterium]